MNEILTYAGLTQENGFWLRTIAQAAVAGERRSSACAPAEKSVVNMI
jgi:hypothetical protein